MKALSARADIEDGQGKTDQAIADLQCAWKLANLIGQDPTVVAMLVLAACEQIVLSSYIHCLDHNHANLVALARLNLGISRLADAPPNLQEAFRGPMYMEIATFRNIDLLGKDDDPENKKIRPNDLRRSGFPPGNISLIYTLLTRTWMASHLRAWTKASRRTNGFRTDPLTTAAVCNDIRREMETDKSAAQTMNGIFWPTYSDSIRLAVNAEARLQAVKGLGYALLAHAQLGAYPATVAFKDPFTSAPLKVKRSADSIRVYSVGMNGKDDGGIDRSELPKDTKAGFDTVAAYPGRR